MVKSLCFCIPVDISNNLKFTLAMLACQNNHFSVLKELWRFSPDLSLKNSDGSNCLIISCANGHLDVLHWLLNNFVDVNDVNNDGNSSFIYAVFINNFELCKMLLDYGADPESKNLQGLCPLSIVLSNSNDNIFDLLQRHLKSVR
eukprot:TRINITY_DN3098_c2_g3_i1.p1 TRINITY_DN3098_c2_g3~~TRINITY_DN3098_c2_g3_i1.p1  ORF type:complete len:145 (+),score=37.69 TRINITY_DN3098_c2_g3_i1:659-1093(+)